MSTACQWNEVTYAHGHSGLPMERWGHRMVRISPSQALLFGGFGGESAQGRYLDDLWLFDLHSSEWQRVETGGEVPEKRSNYTIHHDAANNQVVLFGGGALNKLRYNTIWLLDLSTMRWRRADPDPAQDAPWERTYHCAELSYPYLVTYGGEGVSNIDLDDCWAFNLQTNAWRKLEFANGQEGPGQRRFHSSALIGSHFYVIGGCRDNYELKGDIHRVDLSTLFTHGTTAGFMWERMVSSSRNLERWGHSSDVYDGKIFIFAGRVSATADTNDILVFHPLSSTLQPLKMGGNGPKPRRRHATLMVGSALLCFGGYNGKYLNDFHFAILPVTKSNGPKVNTVTVQSEADYKRKMKDYERKVNHNWRLELLHQGGSTTIRTNQQALLKNDFFRLMHEYSNGGEMTIQLPGFSSVEMFRFIHQLLLEGDAVFCCALPPSHYFQVAAALEYFHCAHFIPVVEQHLLAVLTSDNCLQLLARAAEFQMDLLRLKAAEMVLREGMSRNGDEAWSCENLVSKQDQIEADALVTALREVEKLLRFDIQQAELRASNPNFLARTALHIRRFFQGEAAKEQRDTTEKEEQKAGCFSRVLAFLSRLQE